jgi:large subunit ribosomal protein L17
MRHHNNVRKFGREKNARVALMRSLLRSLILHEQIETTEAKAKELRPMIEKLVTKSRTDSVANRRLVASRVSSEDKVLKKLFETIAPRYIGREGGYTRIIRTGRRGGDARSLAVISFV